MFWMEILYTRNWLIQGLKYTLALLSWPNGSIFSCLNSRFDRANIAENQIGNWRFSMIYFLAGNAYVQRFDGHLAFWLMFSIFRFCKKFLRSHFLTFLIMSWMTRFIIRLFKFHKIVGYFVDRKSTIKLMASAIQILRFNYQQLYFVSWLCCSFYYFEASIFSDW